MTRPDARRSSRKTINEGIAKKGGVNNPPTSQRPGRPLGQGGSGSSSQEGERPSNQGGSSPSNQDSSDGSS